MLFNKVNNNAAVKLKEKSTEVLIQRRKMISILKNILLVLLLIAVAVLIYVLYSKNLRLTMAYVPLGIFIFMLVVNNFTLNSALRILNNELNSRGHY